MNIDNKKKNIIVAGGGFAGLSALKTLCRKPDILKNFNLILVDKKESFDFLPLIPDVVAGRLHSQYAQTNLYDEVRRRQAIFVKGEISAININDRLIMIDGKERAYEYLILACGAEPNFFGNQELAEKCLTLNSVQDAIDINNALNTAVEKNDPFNIVIIGGGYTGIETAMACHFLLKRKNGKAVITIVEKADDILITVPSWLRSHVRKRLEKNKINIATDDALVSFNNGQAVFQKRAPLTDAVCVWSAGVKTSAFIDKVDAEKIRTRIIVDETLRIKKLTESGVVLAGDNAAFIDEQNGYPIRMAAKFAIDQGVVAARNIVHMIKKEELEKYSSDDPGFLIPLIEGRAPGVILNRRIPGRVGFLLHYLISVYHSSNKNKWGIIKDIFISKT